MNKKYDAMIGGEIGVGGSPVKPEKVADKLNAMTEALLMFKKQYPNSPWIIEQVNDALSV